MQFVFLLSVVACTVSQPADSVLRGPCDPLVPEYCFLPTPNSFYTTKNPSTPTGLSLALTPSSLPTDIFGRRIQPNDWNTFDGYPPFPSIVTYFNDIDDYNLPPHWNIVQSLSSNSPTILFDLKTGSQVAHFAELDVSIEVSRRKALMIWPAVTLNHSSHYLVAIKNLRHYSDQSIIVPSYAFKALRDQIATNDTNIEYRRQQYEMFFEALIMSGIIKNRSELQLLWDFHTASNECITKSLVHMRNDGTMRIDSTSGPRYSITRIDDEYTQYIYRHISGVMYVPLYLRTPLPLDSRLVIDSRGLPVYQTDTPVTFTVLIPRSVVNGSIEHPKIVQYGHGLFQSQKEVESDYLQEQANRYGYILVSCDLWGMAKIDLPYIIAMLSENISNFAVLPDRLSQGITNELLLMKLMKGSFSTDPTVMTMLNGELIQVNRSTVHYYGVSLGGIMGHVYMAVSQDVVRGVLGVPGGPIHLILPRSQDFAEFEDGLRLLYPDPVNFMTMLSLLGILTSRCGPGGYMNAISQNTLPNTPTHQVIYQYGLGDAEVNIIGLYSTARSNKAKMFTSNVKEEYRRGNVVITETLFGFEFVNDSSIITDSSLAMGYDCHAPPEPMGNIPPNGSTNTHEMPRRARSAQQQMYLFFKSGEIINTCKGSCNTECHVLC